MKNKNHLLKFVSWLISFSHPPHFIHMSLAPNYLPIQTSSFNCISLNHYCSIYIQRSCIRRRIGISSSYTLTKIISRPEMKWLLHFCVLFCFVSKSESSIVYLVLLLWYIFLFGIVCFRSRENQLNKFQIVHNPNHLIHTIHTLLCAHINIVINEKKKEKIDKQYAELVTKNAMSFLLQNLKLLYSKVNKLEINCEYIWHW